jgi:thiaminase
MQSRSVHQYACMSYDCYMCRYAYTCTCKRVYTAICICTHTYVWICTHITQIDADGVPQSNVHLIYTCTYIYKYI